MNGPVNDENDVVVDTGAGRSSRHVDSEDIASKTGNFRHHEIDIFNEAWNRRLAYYKDTLSVKRNLSLLQGDAH